MKWQDICRQAWSFPSIRVKITHVLCSITSTHCVLYVKRALVKHVSSGNTFLASYWDINKTFVKHCLTILSTLSYSANFIMNIFYIIWQKQVYIFIIACFWCRSSDHLYSIRNDPLLHCSKFSGLVKRCLIFWKLRSNYLIHNPMLESEG